MYLKNREKSGKIEASIPVFFGIDSGPELESIPKSISLRVATALVPGPKILSISCSYHKRSSDIDSFGYCFL